MTPRLASRHLVIPRSAVGVSREQGRWRWFAGALFAAGAAIGSALLVSGQPLPRAASVVVLAVFMAFAVNRFAFFPTELAVTAEAAVLLAAIVAFRSDSPLVGPWCVALLAGPLDVLHWRQRSFVRMAYNAGNRMVATLAAAATFTAVLDHASTRPSIAGAVLAASVVFASVEGAVGVVLVRLRNDEPWRVAARTELPLEALSVPLALVGAGAGYLATEVGWWAAAVVLAPTLFVPELVLARSRHGTAITRVAATIAPGAVGLALLALLVPLPTAATGLGLLAIAVAAGIELRVDLPVPPLIAALAAAAVVVSGRAVVAGAVLVAVVTTAVAWLTAREANWWAPLLAGTAALAAATVYDARPSRVVALLVALVFELVIVAGLARAVWTAPLVCVALALGTAWPALEPFGAAVFGVAIAAVLAASAACGAPPWGSRMIGPWVGRRRPRALRALVVGVAMMSVSCAVAAGVHGSETTVLVALASGAASAVAAMTMCAVRQWRFSPPRQAREAALVLVAAITAVLLYPALARHHLVWSVTILAISTAVCVAIAWPLVRLTARGASGPSREVGDAKHRGQGQ